MSHRSTSGRSRARRFRRGSWKTSPPVRTLCASARRRSTRGPRPRTQRRVRRSPGVHSSRSIAARASAISSGGELREVLVRQRLRIAPGLQNLRRRLDRFLVVPSAPWLSHCGRAPVRWSSVRGWRPGRWRVRATRPSCSRQNASKARSNIARSSRRWTRSARHVWYTSSRSPRFTCCRASAMSRSRPTCTSSPERAQQPAKDQKIAEESGHGAGVTVTPARATRPTSASPWTASMSSFDLSATPSVASTLSGSRVSLSSAASAATQSSVSDTPGSLYSSIARSPCTSAVTCVASRADA